MKFFEHLSISALGDINMTAGDSATMIGKHSDSTMTHHAGDTSFGSPTAS